jgi:hypothetical protein
MEQSKVKARRRTRSQEAPPVDERFRAVTDDGEPASRAQLLVSAAPLTFESVPPFVGSAVPSNELDPHTPRSSGIAVISSASSAPTSSVPSAPSSSIAPSSTGSAAPTASGAPPARGWAGVFLAPALVFGAVSVAVVLALKVMLAPAAPVVKPAAASAAMVGQEVAESPPPSSPVSPVSPVSPATPAPVDKAPAAAQAEPAEDDGFEIIDTPSATPNKPASSQRSSRASRPQPPSGNAPKREPSSPVIF